MPLKPKYRFVLAAILTLSGALVHPRPTAADGEAIYQNAKAPLEARVADLFGKLTQDEKLTLLTGTGFATAAVPRLGVPEMPMADAGQGVRGGPRGTTGPATLFPSGIAMASTWDPELVGRLGRAIGEEALNKGTGVHVLLGPDVNIHRTPQGGRNGEAMSEDPYLAAQLAVGYVRGMQATGCAACIKHFACNNEEVDRDFVNVHVGERALREIYLPAFEAGVTQGGAWTIMSSYNQVNGFHSSANKYLLTDVLKTDWGFDGLVMSDWGGVHETNGTVNAGNDLEMPGGTFLTHDKLAAALAAGQIAQASVDDSVKRVLRTVIRVGLLDGTPKPPDNAVVDSPAHRKLAYEASTKAIVLLKNEGGILPLDTSNIKSLAVIGPRAKSWQMGAYGSPYLDPVYSVQPLDGITRRAGSAVKINYAEGTSITGENGDPIPTSAFLPAGGASAAAATQHGLRAEYYANENLEGPSAAAVTRIDPQIRFTWNQNPPMAGIPRTHFSARWTGQIVAPKTGEYTFTLVADDGCRMWLGGKPIIDHWMPDNGTPQTATVSLAAGQSYDIRVEYYQGEGEAFIRLNWKLPDSADFADAIAAAKASDAAVVFAGASREGEGTDRPSLALPGEQDALIRAVAAANKHTIVVLNNGTPVLMNAWLSKVPGLIEAWFPGEVGGDAIASILFGDVNPSGKLPDTLGARREDYPDFGNFPGKNGQETYAEGIYVGYRHFDKQKIAPLFPFGYGLSYTTFRYSGIKLSSPNLAPGGTVTVTASVTNTGSRAGAEVVELYMRDPAPKIDRPVRELKGFQKVELAPGEKKAVTFTLNSRSLAYFDVPGKRWKADAGNYDLEVGSSSRDIKLKTTVKLTSTFTKPLRP